MILARKGVDHPGLSSEHALQYCLPSTVAVVAGFRAELSRHIGILSLITQIERTRQECRISAALVSSS